MKILLLTDINSPHSRKWAVSLCEAGFEIGIFSFSTPNSRWFEKHHIHVFFPVPFLTKVARRGHLQKIAYLLSVPSLLRTIHAFKPDILHAHYVSSYGIVGALSGFHPYFVSFWGSDIMLFPNEFIFGKQLIRFVLKRADSILSTSYGMVPLINKYSGKKVMVIPFGIDLTIFRPINPPIPSFRSEIVIGTVKSLEEVYGIDKLIMAFKLVSEKAPHKKLKLLIIGGGSKEAEYKELVRSLDVEKQTNFTGPVDFADVPYWHNQIDIFVSLSRSESFGVAVLEASASERPVVVSDAIGFKEIVENEKTGLIIPSGDPTLASEALFRLINHPDLCRSFGKNGRKYVKNVYNWSHSLSQILMIYTSNDFKKKNR
ncbi:MAG: glycosyltransferase family 4 protein [Bacteroidetes bacterium]|nr:glycosyltransferase family 4 protein [Bacteroidota bacterium]